MKQSYLVGTILVTLAFGVTFLARAETAASVSLPQTPWGGSLVDGLDGFEFIPSVDITVTALGWYDQSADGLTHTHPIGIYLTSSQTLLVSNTVTTSSALDSTTNFRFQPIAPLVLKAGTNYTLAGYGAGPGFDPYLNQPAGGVNFGDGITFVRSRSARASGLEFPTVAGSIGVIQDLFLGPNLQFTDRPPSVTLLTPANQIEQTSCVPVQFELQASTVTGEYAITNVAFHANGTNLIGRATNPPYRTTSVGLPHGDHLITVQAFDNFGLVGVSTQHVSIGIRWPTNLHVLRADIAANGDFVGCMCAYSGSNYVVESTTAIQSSPIWLPYVTNAAVNNILSFTNRILTPQRYFRAALWPQGVQTPGAPKLTIVPAAAGYATISWTPNDGGYVLQETTSLSPANWTNSPSGATNPITVPVTAPSRIYRLFKP